MALPQPASRGLTLTVPLATDADRRLLAYSDEMLTCLAGRSYDHMTAARWAASQAQSSVDVVAYQRCQHIWRVRFGVHMRIARERARRDYIAALARQGEGATDAPAR